jgi:hypothetical protein
MTLRENCLPIFENVRILFDQLGFRRYDILLRVVDWSGGTVGKGTKTVTDTPLTIGPDGYGNEYRIGVKRISAKDVLASAGKYTDQDFVIGPITPRFININGQSGGREINYWDPPINITVKREFYYRLTGPSMENGKWFKKIDQEIDMNWSYYFILRASANDPPAL